MTKASLINNGKKNIETRALMGRDTETRSFTDDKIASKTFCLLTYNQFFFWGNFCVIWKSQNTDSS